MASPDPDLGHHHTGTTTWSRRQVLGAGAGVSLAALVGSACGSSSSRANSTTTASNGFVLVQNFPASGYLVTGSLQRMPFVIAGTDGAPLDRIEGDVTLTVTRDGRQVGSPVVATPRSRGLPRSYLPMEVTFDAPGVYRITGSYRGADLTADVQVGERSSVRIPQRGEPLPPVDTPTGTDARGVDPICTRSPACPFHTVNLRDALARQRPVALIISTPAYCQTAICGPVLDELVAIGPRADIDIIHAEVYANPRAVDNIATATPAPVVQAYDLPFEPILFVTNRAGTIVDRYDSIWDRDQLDAVLAGAVA